MKRHPEYYLAGLVSLLTFAVYLIALRNGFVNWDDGLYVVTNAHIRSFDLSLFRWAFLDFYAGNWHPLTWISHALDYALWGLNPLGHHLTSTILHALNTFLVVVLAVRLAETVSTRHYVVSTEKQARSSKESSFGESGKVSESPDAVGHSLFTIHYSRLITAGVTGLLFGLHPLHVESVAWVAERKDLLCALFFLLSILMYVKHAQRDPIQTGMANTRARFLGGYYLLALLFFVLALLSKPMAVSLPVVLLILDWYPFKRIRSMRSFWTPFVEKLPFVAFSLVSSILTVLAQRPSGAMWDIPAPVAVRILAAARALIAYLYEMVVPLNLIPFYPYPMDISFLSLTYGLPLVLVIGISAICAVRAKEEKLWSAAWCYYLITLLPVLGVTVQAGTQFMADRYTYLPSLGPFLVAGLGAAWLTGKALAVKHRSAAPILFAGAAALIVFASMSYATVRQIGIWKSGIDLWSYVIEKEPERVPIAYVNRGTLLFQEMGQLDRAVADFDKAIALNPSNLRVYVNPSYYHAAYLNRGLVFERKGLLQRAMEDMDNALALHPDYFDAYFSRAQLFEKTGQVDKAIADYERATALKPSSFEAYNNEGSLYGRSGAFDKAIELFTRAIAVNPKSSLAYGNRGQAYSLMGDDEKAVRDLNRAIELDRNYSSAYMARGNISLRAGRREAAVSDFQKACELGDKGGCGAMQAVR
jgi:hypothetical protein